MAKKRAHGEGSIYQLKSGKWHARLSISGKRISDTFRTRNEAAAWVRKTAELIAQGLTYQAARITLGEYLNNWLASNQSSLKPTTYKYYKSICETRLIPALGSVPMKDLAADQVQSVYDQWRQEGVGVYAIIKAHSVLHHVLQRAELTGLIVRNAADLARPPKAPKKEMKFWSESDANRFLAAARAHRLYALFYLALAAGMRQMELLGLKWQDLDEARGVIHVSRQLQRSGGKFAPLKTEAATRAIYLGAGTLAVLKEHYQKQIQERTRAGNQWQESGLIFTSTIGSPIVYKNMIDRSFKPLIKAAGVPVIRFHDLRHTAASLMLSQGIAIFIVSKIMGHARPSITSDIYGHLVPGSTSGIGDMMDGLIAPIQIKIPESGDLIGHGLVTDSTLDQPSTLQPPTDGL